MLDSMPCRLLFADDIAQPSYLIPPGVYTDASLPLPLREGRHNRITSLGAVNGFRERGCMIRPLLDASVAANTVVNACVLTIRPIAARGKPTHIGWIIEHIADIAITAGATLVDKSIYHDPDANEIPAGQYRIADGISITLTDLGTALFDAYEPAPSVHSPGDGSQAILMMPDLGGAQGLIIDPSGNHPLNGLIEVMT